MGRVLIALLMGLSLAGCTVKVVVPPDPGQAGAEQAAARQRAAEADRKLERETSKSDSK